MIQPNGERAVYCQGCVQIVVWGRGRTSPDGERAPRAEGRCERCGAVLKLDLKLALCGLAGTRRPLLERRRRIPTRGDTS